MNTRDLLREVEIAFPFVPKPEGLEISFHKVGCHECDYLREDLADVKGSEVDANALRTVVQEMSSLSAKGWRWILPSYLRHCLSVDSTYDDMETEFLIYNLRPDLKYQKDTIARLSLLNSRQIDCLI